jgi:hypothetical protein
MVSNGLDEKPTRGASTDLYTSHGLRNAIQASVGVPGLGYLQRYDLVRKLMGFAAFEGIFMITK